MRVDELIHRHFPRSRAMAVLPDHTTLKGDLFGSDLDVLQLTFDIEDARGQEIPDEEVAALKTVGDVRALAAKYTDA